MVYTLYDVNVVVVIATHCGPALHPYTLCIHPDAIHHRKKERSLDILTHLCLIAPQGKDTLDGECDRLLQREIQRLDAAVVAVGERLLPPTQTVLEAFPSAAGSDGPLHLTLFSPPTGHNYTGVAPG